MRHSLDLADWGELIPRMELDGKIHWYAFAHSYINERVVESRDAINGEKRPDEYPVSAFCPVLRPTQPVCRRLFGQTHHGIHAV